MHVCPKQRHDDTSRRSIITVSTSEIFVLKSIRSFRKPHEPLFLQKSLFVQFNTTRARLVLYSV